jgi:ribonuclease D
VLAAFTNEVTLVSATHPAPAPAWIATREATDAFNASACNHTTVALDTEFIRTQTYYAELGLVQLAIPGSIALVDPLAEGVCTALAPLMADATVLKIVHSASEDLEVLGHALGQIPEPLFDTQTAAVLCGYEMPPSYQKLVQAELGIALDKHATRTDWLKRPLDPEQLRYAAEDVEHLHPLHERLDRQLRELGRSDWLVEDCARAVAKARQASDPYPHLKIRAIERMSPVQQQRLWRLLLWRDGEAAQRNRPKRWILDNPVAIRAAQLENPSRSQLEAAIAADGKPSPRLAQKLEALLQAPAAPGETDIPLQTALSDAEKARAKDLREAVVSTAEQLGISPETLLPRRALEHWARYAVLPDDLLGWRETVLKL